MTGAIINFDEGWNASNYRFNQFNSNNDNFPGNFNTPIQPRKEEESKTINNSAPPDKKGMYYVGFRIYRYVYKLPATFLSIYQTNITQ